MTEPTPLSKENRAFSFGEDIDLSLSIPGQNPSAKKVGGVSPTEVESQPLTGDLGVWSSPKKQQSRGSVHFSHQEDIPTGIPVDSDRPYSRLTYSTISSVPYAESSREAQERATGYDSQQYPSDYELFLAKSRTEYENAQRRNWPTVEIDDGSFLRAKQTKEGDKRKRLASLRGIMRAIQVFVRYFSLRCDC